MSDPRFGLGRLVATREVLHTLSQHDLHTALLRHARGDWGDCCPDDQRANEHAIRQGERILSVYHSEDGEKFYIETAADRSSTCVMLSREY